MTAMNSQSSKAFIVIILLLHLISMSVSVSFNSDSLRSLEGLSKGQAHQAIPDLKDFLRGFGYLNYMDKSKFNDDYYDEDLESAVKLFQKFSGLEVIGMLDSSTIELMIYHSDSLLIPGIDSDPDPLHSLEGLSKGQAHQVIPVKHYLRLFGYLKYMDKSRFNDNYYDEDLESAVKLFQKISNLEVTGMLDSSTIKLMTSSRCLLYVGDHIYGI
ncbi:hypothetical protein FNV43_RR13169 [Rhamnella rubrinervis]|uniref:Peptidoglycan binding-like domain-containing protein n=1 Tax=Rhamnella rubrinervis TaxID=2594499 RepID=A0A8K0H0K7_9ROSA|nr:hypothetical protein FNV43_RR13169 [Rhamnella rubrinervis]